MNHPENDQWLRERLERYDGWLREGKIPTSSRIIPVDKSLAAMNWILPHQQVLEFLRNARSFALTNCACRSRFKRCDNPVEVCFLLNDVADAMAAQGKARKVDLDTARERLALADRHGLVHLTIYNPEQHVYAVCSCCPCCCHDLQFMLRFDRPYMIAKADYVAATDMDACVDCGLCVERCVFRARTMAEDGTMAYDPQRCWGCGLCVGCCPEDAVKMTLRNPPINKDSDNQYP